MTSPEIAPLRNIPTNVMTGFLGVGKTTAILHLLANKPAGERWAVLVNEFGEVGVDGALIAGQHSQEQGVFIREVPGGCMCCAAGLPMQIALNMLLARARPDRLLIEPTGLGHPKEVIESLQAEHYRDLLQLETTVTLVDARNIGNPRYTEHDTFNQQLQIADLIVAHKADQYQSNEVEQLHTYLSCMPETQNVPVVLASQGVIDPALLAKVSRHNGQHSEVSSVAVQASSESFLPFNIPLFPQEGFMSFENQGEGFYSVGWIFNRETQFDKAKVESLLSGLEVERGKAVLRTDNGFFGFNQSQQVLSEVALQQVNDSRIELISLAPIDKRVIEKALLNSML